MKSRFASERVNKYKHTKIVYNMVWKLKYNPKNITNKIISVSERRDYGDWVLKKTWTKINSFNLVFLKYWSGSTTLYSTCSHWLLYFAESGPAHLHPKPLGMPTTFKSINEFNFVIWRNFMKMKMMLESNWIFALGKLLLAILFVSIKSCDQMIAKIGKFGIIRNRSCIIRNCSRNFD